MEEVLKFISQLMEQNNINYHFQRYNTDKPFYPYHIGTLLPTTPTSENGIQEYTFQIDSFTRGSLYNLLEETEKFKDIFPMVEGNITIASGNQMIAAFFCTSEPIETGEESLQRIQTKILIKTMKGGK